MSWDIVFTHQARKDAIKITVSGLRSKTGDLLEVLRENPYETPPPFEKLVGDLQGVFS